MVPLLSVSLIKSSQFPLDAPPVMDGNPASQAISWSLDELSRLKAQFSLSLLKFQVRQNEPQDYLAFQAPDSPGVLRSFPVPMTGFGSCTSDRSKPSKGFPYPYECLTCHLCHLNSNIHTSDLNLISPPSVGDNTSITVDHTCNPGKITDRSVPARLPLYVSLEVPTHVDHDTILRRMKSIMMKGQADATPHPAPGR